MIRIAFLLLFASAGLLLAGPAQAVPNAAQLEINVRLLNLKVNDYATRRQIRVNVLVARENERELLGVKDSRMYVTAPDGRRVEIEPEDWKFTPKRFKVAHATLSFIAVQDTSSPSSCNVPKDFLSDNGPYRLELDVLGEQAHGDVEFADRLGVVMMQDEMQVDNYVLHSGTQLVIFTEPRTIGPVYYKRQDLTNFAFSMASMDQAMQGGDFHYIPETPSYLLQVRIGRAEGGRTLLLDPSRYINGYQPHMIRSDETTTPISFHSDEFRTGDVVVLDFERKDVLDPDTVFSGNARGLTSGVVHDERLIYALHTDLESDAPISLDSLEID
ncbi:hypothetical protein KDL29_11025 [bacterium]|nr:hypothetical protein [bacterium]